jgi:S-adenosylmethionine hydrolase
VGRIVTLLTDFGTGDGFVAAMKGVILSVAPDAHVLDAGHEVPRGDVEAAAWALDQYFFLYPQETVHVVVVDPGVGTARRALAARADGRYLVAPDNGVGTRVFARAGSLACVEIANPEVLRLPVSATFHGRDVFAPAAAHLARGTPLDRLGPPLPDPARLPLPEPRRVETAAGPRLEGRVVHVDRFGNLVTDIPGDWLGDAAWEVTVESARGPRAAPLRRAYGEAAPGEPVAVVSSAGTVEVAVRDGSAADAWGAGRGARVVCARVTTRS